LIQHTLVLDVERFELDLRARAGTGNHRGGRQRVHLLRRRRLCPRGMQVGPPRRHDLAFTRQKKLFINFNLKNIKLNSKKTFSRDVAGGGKVKEWDVPSSWACWDM
jgi:hypothetical protein